MARPRPDELHPIFMFLAALYMHKARCAPKATAGGSSHLPHSHLSSVKLANEGISTSTSSWRYKRRGQNQSSLNPYPPQHRYRIPLQVNAGIHRLATEGTDRAVADIILRLFEEVLKQNPNNVIALIGKARVHYGRNQYAIALRLYQKALTARPDMNPDPRIGIGQCFWHLKMKSDAKAAWERALELVFPKI